MHVIQMISNFVSFNLVVTFSFNFLNNTLYIYNLGFPIWDAKRKHIERVSFNLSHFFFQYSAGTLKTNFYVNLSSFFFIISNIDNLQLHTPFGFHLLNPVIFGNNVNHNTNCCTSISHYVLFLIHLEIS